MFECLNSRNNKVCPQEIVMNIYPTRNKSIEVEKTYINPNNNKCKTCKFQLIPSENIKISKIWKTTYYFCNEKCWMNWCNEFNR